MPRCPLVSFAAAEQWDSPFAFPASAKHIQEKHGSAVSTLLDDHYGFRMQLFTVDDKHHDKSIAVAIHRDLAQSSHISDDPQTTFYSRFKYDSFTDRCTSSHVSSLRESALKLHASLLTGPQGKLQVSGLVDLDAFDARAFAVGQVPLSSVSSTPDVQAGLQLRVAGVTLLPYISIPEARITPRPGVGVLARASLGAWQCLVRAEVDTARAFGSAELLRHIDAQVSVHGNKGDHWLEPQPFEHGVKYSSKTGLSLFSYNVHTTSSSIWRRIVLGGEVNVAPASSYVRAAHRTRHSTAQLTSPRTGTRGRCSSA